MGGRGDRVLRERGARGARARLPRADWRAREGSPARPTVRPGRRLDGPRAFARSCGGLEEIARMDEARRLARRFRPKRGVLRAPAFWRTLVCPAPAQSPLASDTRQSPRGALARRLAARSDLLSSGLEERDRKPRLLVGR